MPEQLTENQLDDLMAELMFAEDIHRGNTGAAGKYGSAVIAIADLRERLASRDAEVAELLAQAWAEGFKQGGPMRDEDASDPDAHTRNPYRSKK